MRKDLAQDICAGARRISFVARSHVAWTHCAAHEMGLAAVARSVALLCGAQDTPSFGESQTSFKLPHSLVRFVAQAYVHRRSGGDLARLVDTCRITCTLYRTDVSYINITNTLVTTCHDHTSSP